jgi:hypothetical protein
MNTLRESPALIDSHVSIILGWWLPQLLEQLSAIQLVVNGNSTETSPSITSSLGCIFEAFLNSSVTAVYLLSGMYILQTLASSSLSQVFTIAATSSAAMLANQPPEPKTETPSQRQFLVYKEKCKKLTALLRKREQNALKELQYPGTQVARTSRVCSLK